MFQPQDHQGKVTLTSMFESHTVYVFNVTLHPIHTQKNFQNLRRYAFIQKKRVFQGKKRLFSGKLGKLGLFFVDEELENRITYSSKFESPEMLR